MFAFTEVLVVVHRPTIDVHLSLAEIVALFLGNKITNDK